MCCFVFIIWSNLLITVLKQLKMFSFSKVFKIKYLKCYLRYQIKIHSYSCCGMWLVLLKSIMGSHSSHFGCYNLFSFSCQKKTLHSIYVKLLGSGLLLTDLILAYSTSCSVLSYPCKLDAAVSWSSLWLGSGGCAIDRSPIHSFLKYIYITDRCQREHKSYN